MKSEFIRVHPLIAKNIKTVAETLNIPSSNASVIVFYGLQKKSMWDKTFPEAKVDYVRKETKKAIAMTL